jgi:hypothetical protein
LMRDSPFLRCSSQLARKGHESIDGLQHRAQRCTWGANVDSTWFVLATEEGAAAHWEAVSWTPFASGGSPDSRVQVCSRRAPFWGVSTMFVCLFVCFSGDSSTDCTPTIPVCSLLGQST